MNYYIFTPFYMTLALLAFIAGLLTILAPCVLPMLPIILLGSLGDKSWKRTFLIIVSLCISIIIFTLLLKISTIFLGVPGYVWKYFSGGIIIFLGIIYLFPHIWQKIGTLIGVTKSHQLLQNSQQIQSKHMQAIATGASLGPVFSSCSPTYAFIIASVFPLSLFEGIIYTTVYTLGVGTLFFAVALFGQSLIRKLRIFSDEKGIFHKIIGLIFVIIGIAIISGYDKKLESRILDRVNVSYIEQSIFEKLNPKEKKMREIPSYDTGIIEVEQTLKEIESDAQGNKKSQVIQNTGSTQGEMTLQKNIKDETIKVPSIKNTNLSSPVLSTNKQVIPNTKTNDTESIENEIDTILKEINSPDETSYEKAPEISLSNWVQGSPVNMADLKGKVVLINFWTLGCINCKNTLSYVESWHAKYASKGLVVIGVHAPEFAYEKKKENVEAAIKEHGLKYTIVMDNDFSLWRAYNNSYWPAFYFIDKKGNIRGSHFGEGNYANNEKLIQSLLEES